MSSRFTIVGIGEALFDIFPDRQMLGGAPLNVAVHAHQLGQSLGGRGVVVSRVGQDDLGQQVLGELSARGMETSFVQTDPDYATGRVYVDFDASGGHRFDVVRDVAWDWLQFDPDTETLARSCDAVCFGTLAQREAQTRNTIYRFLDSARRAIRLFDVNLRQDFFSPQMIRRSLENASALKLNHEELPTVCAAVGLSGGEPGSGYHEHLQAQAILKKFNLRFVALTRGARGTVLVTRDGAVEGEPVNYPVSEGADRVGAGDACTAGLLIGMVLRWPAERVVNLANRMGGYVAASAGATPAIPEEIARLIH